MGELDKVKELINLMVERGDIYITIYVGEYGTSISVYPLTDDKEVVDSE